MKIKVLLVDDQTLVRSGIRSLLSLSEKIEVVGEAADGRQAIAEILDKRPDTVLMDIRMPVMNGIETVLNLMQEHKEKCPPIIMLTTFDDHELVLQALTAGAKGYLLKDVSLETLVDAVVKVNGGETLIQPAITERVLQGLQGKKTQFDSIHQPENLTEKEIEILRLMASGCSNREISLAMFKSEGTVKNQVSNVLAKLGVRDRTRAVLKAIELGVI